MDIFLLCCIYLSHVFLKQYSREGIYPWTIYKNLNHHEKLSKLHKANIRIVTFFDKIAIKLEIKKTKGKQKKSTYLEFLRAMF